MVRVIKHITSISVPKIMGHRLRADFVLSWLG